MMSVRQSYKSVGGQAGGDDELWFRTGTEDQTKARLKKKGFIRLQDRQERRFALELCCGKPAWRGLFAT